jgi:cell division protein FtsZ
MRKVERKPFAEPEVAAAAPVAAATSTSWFGDAAAPATETIDVSAVNSYYADASEAPEATEEYVSAEPTKSEADERRQSADGNKFQSADGNKFQSADGTWGDDLDIPDFLR